MKLGLIARADNSGLGIQTHEFYKHMKPTKTLVVDIGMLNKNQSYPERYTEYPRVLVNGFPTDADIDHFLMDLDVVFLAEAPYNFYLYERAKQLGIKVANQYNYEFFDYYEKPHWPKPDMLIAPSQWHYDEVDSWCKQNKIEHVYLHCPVNRELLPMRKITTARTFLHIAGKAAAHDRNGTETVISAARLLKTNAQILIHFQGEQGLAHQATNSVDDYMRLASGVPTHQLQFRQFEYENYNEVYAQGDVLLLPRRYGGNCLPLNEAISCGMPVLMPDISPNNQFLPRNWLLAAEKISTFKPRTEVDIYNVKPPELAQAIDDFYNYNQSRMRFENLTADKLAQSISWKALKPEYERVLGALCKR